MNLEKEHEMIISKLADIRNLFDESDRQAEGHGMEDAVSDPYAVAVYAENKLKRLIEEVQRLEEDCAYWKMKYRESVVLDEDDE